MSLTVQSVTNECSLEVRQVLGTTSTDLTIFTNWIDRCHKDCLHSSLYQYLNIFAQTVNTVVGTRTYNLTGNIRRVIGIYDVTRDRILFPIDRATAPISQVEKQEPQPGQKGGYDSTFPQLPAGPISLQTKQPGYFRLINSGVLVLYPTPQAILQLSVAYEQQVVTLVNPTDVLIIPEDGRDMIVAGVNYLANLFLKRPEEAQLWLQIYESLKTGKSLI